MAQRLNGLAGRIQSLGGLQFLLGLVLIGVPLVIPPANALVAWTEIVGGLIVLALGALGAWQGRLHHVRPAVAPAIALMAVAVGLSLLMVLADVTVAHAAAVLVVGAVLFLAAAADAWTAWRAIRHPAAA